MGVAEEDETTVEGRRVRVVDVGMCVASAGYGGAAEASSDESGGGEASACQPMVLSRFVRPREFIATRLVHL